MLASDGRSRRLVCASTAGLGQGFGDDCRLGGSRGVCASSPVRAGDGPRRNATSVRRDGYTRTWSSCVPSAAATVIINPGGRKPLVLGEYGYSNELVASGDGDAGDIAGAPSGFVGAA